MDANSISTSKNVRDTHLKNADFLEKNEHTLNFESTKAVTLFEEVLKLAKKWA